MENIQLYILQSMIREYIIISYYLEVYMYN